MGWWLHCCRSALCGESIGLTTQSSLLAGSLRMLRPTASHPYRRIEQPDSRNRLDLFIFWTDSSDGFLNFGIAQTSPEIESRILAERQRFSNDAIDDRDQSGALTGHQLACSSLLDPVQPMQGRLQCARIREVVVGGIPEIDIDW